MKTVLFVILIVYILGFIGSIIWYIYTIIEAKLYYQNPQYDKNINIQYNEYMCKIIYRKNNILSIYKDKIYKLNKAITNYYNNLLNIKKLSPKSTLIDQEFEITIPIS